MFEDLYDAISMLWSWTWPTADGVVTEVVVDRRTNRNGGDNRRLAVAFEFSIGDDGPYTGESFWAPIFLRNQRVVEARPKIRRGKKVSVRYRPDDPSVNRLDRSAWDDL